MKKIIALSIGILFSGISQTSMAVPGEWSVSHPAPVITSSGTYVTSPQYFGSSVPAAKGLIKRLSWDFSPYGNGNTRATYEICMLPGTSRCFNASNNLRSSTNFFNYFRSTDGFIVRIMLNGGTYPATPTYTGNHLIHVDFEY